MLLAVLLQVELSGFLPALCHCLIEEVDNFFAFAFLAALARFAFTLLQDGALYSVVDEVWLAAIILVV